MAVKIGKIPPRESKTESDSGAAFATWVDDNGQFGALLGEQAERCRKMEFIYERMSPNWQDQQPGRGREFSELFKALNGHDGLFSRNSGRKGKRVYLPAANRQLETRVFADHCDDALFIGGDLVRSAIAEGKARTKSQNADFVAADGFHVPFEEGSLDAVVDVAGAAWYALDTPSKEKATQDLKSLLHEWHRALGRKGVVVLDDYPKTGLGYVSTMRRMEEVAPDIFGNVKKGGFYFQVEDYRVAFKARTVKVGSGRAYVFEKV